MYRRAVSLLLVAPLLALIAGSSAQAARSRSTTGTVRPATVSHGDEYRLKNLVSDVPGRATHTDPNLVNAWGLVAGPSTPWWVSDNGTDVSTIYGRHGEIMPLVVQVAGAPTGIVFNGGSNFVISDGTNSGPAIFIFATEAGTIRGWNPSVPPPPPSTQTFVGADRSGVGALYKGLATATTKKGDFLYATDFHNSRVDMFDGKFKLVTPKHAFVDPRIPGGYAPFGIQNIHGAIVVTYAKQDADKKDDVPGPGRGFVDAFSTTGRFLGRIASRGHLNAPWGLAVAPDSFGRFGGDLLIGNFGDGRINAYGRHHDEGFGFEGTLMSRNERPIVIDGLWALEFGNGGPSGPTGTLFFTAGPDGEAHGLFGKIEPTE